MTTSPIASRWLRGAATSERGSEDECREHGDVDSAPKDWFHIRGSYHRLPRVPQLTRAPKTIEPSANSSSSVVAASQTAALPRAPRVAIPRRSERRGVAGGSLRAFLKTAAQVEPY